MHERKIVKVGLENPYTFWRLKTATSEHQYVRVRTGDGPGLGPGLNNVKTRRAGDREVHHSHNGHRSQREMGQPWQDGKAGQAGWTRTTTLEVDETLFTQAGPDSNWTGGGLGQCEGVAPRFTAAAANTGQQATEIGWHHAYMAICELGMTERRHRWLCWKNVGAGRGTRRRRAAKHTLGRRPWQAMNYTRVDAGTRVRARD